MPSFRNLLGLPVKAWDDRAAGQVLQLSSDKEHWEFGAGGGGGTASPLTTKGDLYGYDTGNARVPIGTDGQVLVADSTKALGVKWAEGNGIHIDDRVATYAALPSPPTEGTGATYLVDADGLLYVWDGSAWPTNGSGIAINPSYTPSYTAPSATNIARGRCVYHDFVLDAVSQGTSANPQTITDGNTRSTPYVANGTASGLSHVVVDLDNLFAIGRIVVWHYWSDGRTYHDTKTDISADGVHWTTIFDSAVSGEYAETSSGHTMTLGPAKNVRYIRDAANGSTANTSSHWVEIQAYSS